MKNRRYLPIVSGGLVICNVIVYICCLFGIGNLYDTGSLDAYAVIYKKEYIRILSSVFLHANTAHLFNNMLILFFMGAMIEKEIGHIRFVILFFLSGIGGNLMSLYAKVRNADTAVSIGASGAVFGLDGVLLAMVLFWGNKPADITPKRVCLMIFLSLYSGLTGAQIDNAAHIGGLITGFVAGSIMCVIHRAGQKRQQ
ncbi:MAG: rhomboid family intramembrane serine protease [Acetatifactor sp.]